MQEMVHTAEPVLIRSTQGGVVTLELNRPRQMNCLSEALLSALDLEFGRLSVDPTVKCVVLGGKGRVFCAGHDLKEMQSKAALEYYRWLFSMCSRVMQSIRNLPVPVIAKVQGDATAAGCQLVATCDLAIAADTARFAAAGVNIGSFCGTPAVAITRKVAAKRSFEMLFTGRFVDAPAAVEWGLINSIVPAAKLDAAVGELASKIASKSGVALRFGKSLFYRQRELGLSDAYELATEGLAQSLMEPDAHEGIDAFLSKREPRWND